MLVLAQSRRWTLPPRCARCEKLADAEDFLEDAVSHLGGGDGHLAEQGRSPVSPILPPASAFFSRIGSIMVSIRLRKKLATEATRSMGLPLIILSSSPAEVCLGHLAVPREAEEERDVDIDPLADQLPDGGEPLRGCRYLDEDVRPVHGLPEHVGLIDCSFRVVGQAGGDLKADKTVPALQAVIEGAELIRGKPDVMNDKVLVYLVGIPFLPWREHGYLRHNRWSPRWPSQIWPDWR